MLHLSGMAQPISKAAKDAFVITRMAAKFHVQPRAIDDAFSADVYTALLNEIDDDKLFFTTEDIKALSAYQFSIDDEIKGKQTRFLQTLIAIYKKRLLQADTMVTSIAKASFVFSLPEKFTVAEDTSYPVNEAAMRKKLYKVLKFSVLDEIEDLGYSLPLSPKQQKKLTDSVEPATRQKMQKYFKRRINAMLQSPGGIEQSVSEEYCNAIAKCFDPHTEYFPPTEKENFESELGQKAMAFGFSLDVDKDDNVVINELKPGSPAFKSGQLNKGDKILSIQWEGKEPIDVSAASMREIGAALGASNHDNAKLKIKKTDGSIKEITLWKEMLEDDDDEGNVKSYLLKGSKTIGYISLPAFYEDWENNSGVNGCANDVAKEIMKLKKENIEGLIINLRYNGGGSLSEAIGLIGLFIDAGPVGQYKTKDPKVITLKDGNRGTIYDGPLIILVNGYSASASEIVAGTLQDYNRAVIVGSPTFGKATGQVVLPMDTTINLESDNIREIKADSYLKITDFQLFRITGKTAQGSGVIPDILLPDALEVSGERESDNKLAIKLKEIDANKYYKPLAVLEIAALKTVAQNKVSGISYFKLLKEYIATAKSNNAKQDISLTLQTSSKKEADELPSLASAKEATAAYKAENNSFDKQKLSTNSSMKEMDLQSKKELEQDPYITIAYELAIQMKN